MGIKAFELVCYILPTADQTKTRWWQGHPPLSGAQKRWHSADNFLPGEKCTLDKKLAEAPSH